MHAEIAHFLAKAARAAPSADNSQPLDFSWDGRRFIVSFSRTRGEGKLFGPGSHSTLLALGACIENIDTAMASVGIRGRWKFEQASLLSGMPYAELSIDDEKAVTQIPENLPLFARHTNRFPYKKSRIPSSLMGNVNDLERGGARLLVVQDAEQKAALVRHARIAAESRFCTPELHDWLMGSLRFTASEIGRGEGLDVHTVHLPPGGEVFLRFIADWRRMAWLNRFGAFKALAITETLLLNDAPSLICLVGDTAPSSVIDAGRLLSRVWSDLNAMEIAVHPYYVITDQLFRLQSATVPEAMVERVQGIRDTLPFLLGTTSGETLHMVLRIGFPRRQPPRSQRLPLETVFRDSSSN